MSDVHFHLRPAKKGAPTLLTVCQRLGLVQPLRTLLPRLVTCPACLDWIAANYRTVIAQCDAIRGAA